jgi:hypothetical protein
MPRRSCQDPSCGVAWPGFFSPLTATRHRAGHDQAKARRQGYISDSLPMPEASLETTPSPVLEQKELFRVAKPR